MTKKKVKGMQQHKQAAGGNKDGVKGAPSALRRGQINRNQGNQRDGCFEGSRGHTASEKGSNQKLLGACLGANRGPARFAPEDVYESWIREVAIWKGALMPWAEERELALEMAFSLPGDLSCRVEVMRQHEARPTVDGILREMDATYGMLGQEAKMAAQHKLGGTKRMPGELVRDFMLRFRSACVRSRTYWAQCDEGMLFVMARLAMGLPDTVMRSILANARCEAIAGLQGALARVCPGERADGMQNVANYAYEQDHKGFAQKGEGKGKPMWTELNKGGKGLNKRLGQRRGKVIDTDTVEVKKVKSGGGQQRFRPGRSFEARKKIITEPNHKCTFSTQGSLMTPRSAPCPWVMRALLLRCGRSSMVSTR